MTYFSSTSVTGTHMFKIILLRESHASVPNMGLSLMAQLASKILWQIQTVFEVIFLHGNYFSIPQTTYRFIRWGVRLCSFVCSTGRAVCELCAWFCQWLCRCWTRLQEQVLGLGHRLWVLHCDLRLCPDPWTAGGDCLDSDSGSQPCPRSGKSLFYFLLEILNLYYSQFA